MIGCDETITIVHHVKADDDTYICYTVNNASWFAKTSITTDGNGAKPVNSYTVRIMGDVELTVENGDYCVKGVINNVTKPSDLKGREHFRITAIGFNKRHVLPHWRVSGQ